MPDADHGSPITLANGLVVTPTGVLEGGWISIDGPVIAGVGAGPAPRRSIDVEGRWILPGFVDLHVHGGGGHTFTSGDPAQVAGGVGFHLRHGTTRTLASLVTRPIDDMVAATERLRGAVGDLDTLVGIHLEGPFLATARCGAQDPDAMLDPDTAVLDRLLAAGGGHVRMVTLAPERPGALAIIRHLVSSGVIAAVGHSDASAEEADAAFASGASVVTHLFNCMALLHHRRPGLAGAALTAPEVVCELIVDGVHVHPTAVRMAAAAKGMDDVALVTDAIAAAGGPDGRYRLGDLEVEVSAHVARLTADGALAGSTLTMAAAVRTAVEAGIPLPTVSRYASTVPARVLGLEATGSLVAGKDADIVVLDEGLQPVTVVARGRVVEGAAWLHGRT